MFDSEDLLSLYAKWKYSCDFLIFTNEKMQENMSETFAFGRLGCVLYKPV